MKKLLLCIFALNIAFAQNNKYNLIYHPDDIKSRIAMFAMQFPVPGDQMPLYENPPLRSNTELILLSQSVK